MKEISEFYLRYRLLVVPVLTGLASLITLVLVIIPQLLAFLNVRTEIQSTQERSARLEAKAQTLETFDETTSQQDLRTVFSVLPTDRNVPQAIAILQDLISRAGLTLKSTSYNASMAGSGSDSFQLNITVFGAIGSLRNFFIALENTGRIFQVESIDVQFQRSGAGVEADIPLRVFYNKNTKATVSLESDAPKLNDKEQALLSRLPQLLGSSGAEATASSIPVGKADPFN